MEDGSDSIGAGGGVAGAPLAGASARASGRAGERLQLQTRSCRVVGCASALEPGYSMVSLPLGVEGVCPSAAGPGRRLTSAPHAHGRRTPAVKPAVRPEQSATRAHAPTPAGAKHAHHRRPLHACVCPARSRAVNRRLVPAAALPAAASPPPCAVNPSPHSPRAAAMVAREPNACAVPPPSRPCRPVRRPSCRCCRSTRSAASTPSLPAWR